MLLSFSAAFAEDVVSPAAMEKLAASKNKKPAAKKTGPAAKQAKKPEDGSQSAVEKVESLPIKPEQEIKSAKPKAQAAPSRRETPKPGGPQYNYILFESQPPNAELTLDGFYMGNTPIELPVKDGSHDIKLSHIGYGGWNRKIMTFAGFRVYAVLEAVKPAEAPKP